MHTGRLARITAALLGLGLAVTLSSPVQAGNAPSRATTGWAPTAHWATPVGTPATVKHVLRRTPDGTTSTTKRLHRRALLVHPTKATVRGRYLDGLKASGLPAASVWRPRARDGEIPPRLLPAAAFSADGSADIDDDGHADLLQVQPLDRRGTSVKLALRRGSNGAVRWRKSAHDVVGFIALRKADGKHVFVVMTLEFSGPARPRSGDVVVVTLTLTAYDARSGDQRWLTTLTGDETFDRFHGFPVLVGADGLPYPETVLGTPDGHRILFSELFLEGSFRDEHVWTEFNTVDAQSGAIADSRVRVDGDYAAAFTLGDVTGDGYDDITTFGRHLGEFSGRTGAAVWTGMRAFPLDTLPDATGDGRPDLLAYRFGHGVSVVNGHTGNATWSFAAFGAFGVGDIDGDGLTDVVAERGIGFRAKRVGAKLTAIDAHGDAVWRARVTVKRDKGKFGIVFAFGGVAGDADGDGVTDVVFGVVEDVVGHPRRSRFALVDGATGAVDDGIGRRDPLRASLDGHGDDFIKLKDGAHWQVIVRDGRDWDEIFAFGRHGTKATRFDAVYATPLTDDNRAELVVSVHDFDGAATYVVDGRTHDVRWAVHT